MRVFWGSFLLALPSSGEWADVACCAEQMAANVDGVGERGPADVDTVAQLDAASASAREAQGRQSMAEEERQALQAQVDEMSGQMDAVQAEVRECGNLAVKRMRLSWSTSPGALP